MLRVLKSSSRLQALNSAIKNKFLFSLSKSKRNNVKFTSDIHFISKRNEEMFTLFQNVATIDFGDLKMATCFGCLRWCLSSSPPHVPLKEQPVVVLDTNYMGNDVVIVKNGRRICGGGAALANVPIVQSKAYFEVKIQQGGQWGVGLATRKVDLNRVPLGMDAESWVMCSDGVLRHNGEDQGKVSELPQEGDIVGVSYDHVEVNFYLNGKNMQNPIMSSRGTLFPVVYVEDGAIIDVLFGDFFHSPPSGYDHIMIEQSLL